MQPLRSALYSVRMANNARCCVAQELEEQQGEAETSSNAEVEEAESEEDEQ